MEFGISLAPFHGAGENPSGPGIANTGAGTINKHLSGAVDVENSSHVTVKGWQMSASGSDIFPNWVTLDPGVGNWGVGGVRFFGVTNSTVDHNAINNCTSVSISLFHSSHNTVSDNACNYPLTMNFLVTDGSSYNTLVGNDASTGDFCGLTIADPLPGTPTLKKYGASHDNIVTDNLIHTDGPTGNELAAGVVPAFLGGVVVLNGTYNNMIVNNQGWASTGNDFVWAQAVPDSSSPIGVENTTSASFWVHCNVTASEGGGGVSNLNGNVWKKNTFKAIDPCLPSQQ